MDDAEILEQLALTWRLCGELGLADGILNHCSVRLGGQEPGVRLALTPGHLLANEVRGSDLAIVQFSGSKTSPKEPPPGLMLHGCILQARPDVASVPTVMCAMRSEYKAAGRCPKSCPVFHDVLNSRR